MANTRKHPNKPIWLWLVIPPVFFMLKDFIAIQIMWSHEPGITEEVANNFALHLLPGTLFVIAASAPVVNLGLGILVGVFSYLLARRHRRRSLILESDGF